MFTDGSTGNRVTVIDKTLIPCFRAVDGFTYVDGSDYPMRMPGYIGPDGVHPNDNGQIAIFRAIRQYIESGTITFNTTLYNGTITTDTTSSYTVSSGYLTRAYRYGRNAYVLIPDTTFATDLGSLTTQLQPLCNFANDAFNPEYDCNIEILARSGGNFARGYIMFRSGKCMLRLMEGLTIADSAFTICGGNLGYIGLCDNVD